MTKNEFMTSLKAHAHLFEWDLIDMCIRGEPKGDGCSTYSHCPITAVCRAEMGMTYDSGQAMLASSRMGLSAGVTDLVMMAADSMPVGNSERLLVRDKLRGKLLKAVGLEE